MGTKAKGFLSLHVSFPASPGEIPEFSQDFFPSGLYSPDTKHAQLQAKSAHPEGVSPCRRKLNVMRPCPSTGRLSCTSAPTLTSATGRSPGGWNMWCRPIHPFRLTRGVVGIHGAGAGHHAGSAA